MLAEAAANITERLSRFRSLNPSYTPTLNQKAPPMTRSNLLYLVIGALVVVVAVLGYQYYQDHKEPKGVQLNIGPSGVSIEKK
jgi:RsiW-degrading membrane proteinase PrsW (M82 family)